MYNKLHKQYTLQFDILQYKTTFRYRGDKNKKGDDNILQVMDKMDWKW